MTEVFSREIEVKDLDLLADLVRQLRAIGKFDRLGVSNIISPTISVGSLRPTEILVTPPAFARAELNTAGPLLAQAAGTAYADTGQLQAGDYDVIALAVTDTTGGDVVVEWRDSTNTAQVMAWPLSVTSGRLGSSLALSLAGIQQNERVRITQLRANSNGWVRATVGAKRRPTI